MAAATRDQLLRRREQLVLSSAQARADWALQAQVLRRPLDWVDRARAAAQWLVQHPEWPIGALLVVAVLRPGRALRWASYAWQGYGLYRRVQRLMAGPRMPQR
jgi:hypothetical protein